MRLTTPIIKPKADEEPDIAFGRLSSGADKFSLVDGRYLDRRQIHIIDEITDSTFEQVKNLYDEMVEIDRDEPIHVIVGTNGGDVRSMLGIMNLILLSKTPVYTYLMGETCSAGSWIYLCGHKRFASNTNFISFMLHPIEWNKADSYGNHRSHNAYLEKLNTQLVNFTASKTKIPIEKLQVYVTSETYYFVGPEVFESGIATDELTSSTFWLAEKKPKAVKKKKAVTKEEVNNFII